VIRFALSCIGGHRFEGWFGGSEAFEAQKATGSVTCPICGSADVDKALMTPAVSTSRGGQDRPAAVMAHEPEAAAMLRKLRERLTETPIMSGIASPRKLAASTTTRPRSGAFTAKLHRRKCARSPMRGLSSIRFLCCRKTTIRSWPARRGRLPMHALKRGREPQIATLLVHPQPARIQAEV
jgi:hypothetical protein